MTAQDYNRELAAKDAGDMEQWLAALHSAMDAADTGACSKPTSYLACVASTTNCAETSQLSNRLHQQVQSG